MTRRSWLRILIVCAISVLVAIGVWTTAKAQLPQSIALTPKDTAPQRNAYFGDLHTHTIYSLDAYMGFIKNSPNDAYEFAQGKPKQVPGGTTQRKVPLDFAAVTDHAEFLAEMGMALDPSNPHYNDETAAAIRNEDQSEEKSTYVFTNVVQGATRSNTRSELGSLPDAPAAARSVWKKIQQATEANYKPGKFTTLHAFEWSSAPGGANLHRNVIFRDKVVPDIPVNAFDTQSPEVLWQTLSQYEKNGSTVLAIPHNGNASANKMFMPQQFDGKPMNPAWAKLRAKYEPLFEIMQIKGTSETLPRYAPEDEFADFELLDVTERTRGRYGYIREALKNGLRHEAVLGTNPFKYGIVGATDSHNGVAGDTEEDDYIGSHGFSDATPELRQFSEIPGWESFPRLNPGALTGVWAEQNNRESIFDAFQRKETFGTSGNRISVRFFGGWNYSDGLNKQPDMITKAYANGVPMGRDLPAALNGKAPKFLVWATKDPNGGNLDRIQVVKGWTKHGLTYEKVYNVIWAGSRQPNRKGNLPPIGSTVNVQNASYTNSIGSPELSTVWTDPDFDPALRAVYYVRVLEIPTPRYSTHDAAKLGIRPNPVSPTEIQERAWTSPIWYTPSQAYLAKADANALTVSRLQQSGTQALSTAEITRLISGHNLTIKNRMTGEKFLGFFQADGTWFLAQTAGLAPLHTGELEAAAPTKYKVQDNQLIFNLKDGSEFAVQIYRQGNQILAARNDEIGYVNYELGIS